MSVKLLTEHHLEFTCISFKRGCTGSSECTLVKILHSWKLHVAARMLKITFIVFIIPIVGNFNIYEEDFHVQLI